MADTEKRSIWWWLGAVLTPLGIIGGPVELANLFSGLIEWHGPIGFVVEFWRNNIALPFHSILQYLVDSILTVIHFPRFQLPWWISDYIVLGILSFSSYARSIIFLYKESSPLVIYENKPKLLVHALKYLFLWPIYFIFALWAFIKLPFVVNKDTFDSNPIYRQLMIHKITTLLLFILPFAIFLLIFISNVFYGHYKS